MLIAPEIMRRQKRSQRTRSRVHRVAHRRRADHGDRFAPQPADHRLRRQGVDPAGAGVERPERTRDARRIFSVIQKVEDHYSNLYDDAYMPHMQRITWSGIALHGGVLPGYAASHGCVRMPFDFAARLFDETAMGMRVIVAPTDVAPVEIAHPLLFQPKPGAAALAAARTAEAQEASRKAAQARLAAVTAFGRPRVPWCRCARRKI